MLELYTRAHRSRAHSQRAWTVAWSRLTHVRYWAGFIRQMFPFFMQPVRSRRRSFFVRSAVHNLLYVRFREGFALKCVDFDADSDGGAENKARKCLDHNLFLPSAIYPVGLVRIQLRLPWQPLISLEYHILAPWPHAYHQS